MLKCHIFNFPRIINKERKEKFFRNIEEQLGVSLKEIARDKISVERTEKGVSFKPKSPISKEDRISNPIEEVTTKSTGTDFNCFLTHLKYNVWVLPQW